MRCLDVYFEGDRVGMLTENEDLWAFTYDEAWCTSPDGFDLSPALPRGKVSIVDGASDRPVQWYFDNLLPEEGLRQVYAKEAQIHGDDAFGLLAHYGRESAGALTLVTEGEGDSSNAPEGLKPLPFDELSRRIRNLPRASLQHDAPKRMSLAGAQHKMLVVFDGQNLYEPEPGTVSTHILKPDHPSPDYAASVINEFFIMRLAKRMGLDVPEVDMLYVPEPVYIVKRFDRESGPDGRIRRLHLVDSCQLLNRSRQFKYQGARFDALKDMIRHCRVPAKTRLQLFQWLVFNALVGNGDNHLKNISFLAGPTGTRLAPAYDLLSTAVYDTRALADERATWPRVNTVFQWDGRQKQFGEMTASDLIEAGASIGVRRFASGEVRRQARDILSAADAVATAVRNERAERIEQSPDPAAARQYTGIEDRVMNAIRHIVLAEMQRQLDLELTVMPEHKSTRRKDSRGPTP